MSSDCILCQDSPEPTVTLDSKKHSKRLTWKVRAFILVLLVAAAVSFTAYQIWPGPTSEPVQEEVGIVERSNPLPTAAQVQSGEIKEGIQVGQLAPDFTGESASGEEFTLSSFRNEKPVLLVFWATWCGFCAQELPDLKLFTQEYQDRIQIVVIASGESKEIIQKYISEKEVNFMMLLDQDRSIWNQYIVRGTPTHVAVDREGKVAAFRPGLATLAALENMFTMAD